MGSGGESARGAAATLDVSGRHKKPAPVSMATRGETDGTESGTGACALAAGRAPNAPRAIMENDDGESLW